MCFVLISLMIIIIFIGIVVITFFLQFHVYFMCFMRVLVLLIIWSCNIS